MMLERLEEIQLQWRNLDGGTTSLLSQAHVLGSVQPCCYTLMAAGTPRVFSAHWIGLLDLASGVLPYLSHSTLIAAWHAYSNCLRLGITP